MLALTLIQPWAFASTHLDKDAENRSWRPPPRAVGQRIAIHAGRKCERDMVALLRVRGMAVPGVLEQGALVGVAVLAGWVHDSGNWSPNFTEEEAHRALRSRWYIPGSVGWVWGERRALPAPIKCAGALGLWPTERAANALEL